VITATNALALDKQEPFILIDLRLHKAVPLEHLLLYVGKTPEQVRHRQTPIKLTTDTEGRTSFLWNPNLHWFQLWLNETSDCPHPLSSKMVFDSSVVFDEGIVVANTCLPTVQRLQPDVHPLHPLPPVVP
jgi:hypothetical protein